MLRDHPVKHGEKYETPKDVEHAYWRACCHRCVMIVMRNSVNQGYYITKEIPTKAA